jgi:hypothetical protein
MFNQWTSIQIPRNGEPLPQCSRNDRWGVEIRSLALGTHCVFGLRIISTPPGPQPVARLGLLFMRCHFGTRGFSGRHLLNW